MEQRNNLLDIFKILAASAVMILHTKLGDISFEVLTTIRYLMRWAVPFFFISSGYFLGLKTKGKRIDILAIDKSLKSLISIFIIASTTYFLIMFVTGKLWVNNDIKFLLIGSFWHIWFIGSILYGLLFVWFLSQKTNLKFIYILMGIGLITLISINQFTLINYNEIPRFLSGFIFLSLGIFIANNNSKIANRQKKVISFSIISAVILAFEITYNLKYADLNQIFDREISFGITLITISIFLISISFKIGKNKLAEIGNKYSLFIFIYHVLVYKIMETILTHFNQNLANWYPYFPCLNIIMLIATAMFLDLKFKKVFNFLTGKS